MKKILGISLFAMMAVTTANAEIASKAFVEAQDDAVKALITSEATTRSEADTAITNKIGTIPTEGVGAGSANVIAYVDAKVANANSGTTDAIAGLNASVSQTAGTDGLALTVTEVGGKLTGVSGSIAANTYDAYGAASTAESNANTYTDTKVGALGTHVVEGQPVDYDVKTYVTDQIATVTSAANSLEGRVTTAESDIDALEAKVGDTAVSTQISNAITAENLSQYQTVANKVTTLDAQSDDNHYPSAAAVYTAVQNANTATADAIADLDANVSQTAGGDGLALSVTEVDGVITAVSGSIAANTYDAYGAASNAVAALDDTSGTAQAGKWVTAVTQTDGKITATMADPLAEFSKLTATQGSGKYALTATVDDSNNITGYAWELIERNN